MSSRASRAARDEQNPSAAPPEPSPPPRPNADETAPGLDLFYYVVECHDKGCIPSEVQKHLVASGYPTSAAEKIIADVAEWRRKNPDAPGKPGSGSNRPGGVNPTMVFGGLICLGGIIITAVTFLVASERGGTYYVAWGAIVFGAIMCLRAAAQAGREMESKDNRES